MTWEEMLKQNNDVLGGTSAKRHPRHHEDRLQIQCVRWFSLQYPNLAPLLHHSPNGGARSKAEGAIFKQMGVRAGFPDLFLYIPRYSKETDRWTHGLAIEMKTHDRGSAQSPEQRRWQKQLTEQGYLYVVCRDIYEFQTIINTYLQHEHL